MKIFETLKTPNGLKMKTCIIALLAVLVGQGEAFPFPGFDLETQVAKSNVFAFPGFDLETRVANSNVFAFPGSGIQARAGTTSTFPADTDFYCATCDKIMGASDAVNTLYNFAYGNNVEESPVIFGYDTLVFANDAFEISKFCFVASSATPKRVTSADGSVTRFTPSSSREYFAVEGTMPNSDADVKKAFDNLKQEIDAAGLTARADLTEPMIYVTSPNTKVYFMAFLD